VSPSDGSIQTNGGGDTSRADALTAIDLVAGREMAPVAIHAANTVPEASKADVAKAVVAGVPTADKASVATAAVNAVPTSSKVDVLSDALRAAPVEVRDQLLDRLRPDQHVTNKIWQWIVVTFAVVLIGTMLALIAAIFVGFWRKTDAAMVQILLTVFTTSAGILAGFISGRASSSGGR
jgi:hypothetical protein